MKKQYLNFSLSLIAMLLVGAGCASLGLVQPKGLDQSLAYAYGTHTTLVNSATAALQSKTITIADAQQVLELAKQSRTLLDAARAAQITGDTSTAMAKVALASSILTQLQTYLTARGAK